jgi:hypothetical protein
MFRPSIRPACASEHGDIVAVADERERLAGERPELLAQRQHVGQRLARMLLVGQRIDDVKARSGGREPGQPILAERAHDQAREPALEVARDVFERLAALEHRRSIAVRSPHRRARGSQS